MRALIQRVRDASVTVDEKTVGEIGPGLLVLICAMSGDTEAEGQYLAEKIAKLRIFKDQDGKMNRSVKDIEGSILVVSQFTLAADTRRGNRPGFSAAADPEEGNYLYQDFATKLEHLGLPVARGVFGADMQVSLTNDGPVTIWMDTEER